MKITYDPEADVLYIEFRENPPVESINIEEGIYYEIDEAGKLVGLEVIYASDKLKDFNKVEFIHYPLPAKRKAKKRSPKKEAASA